jgi:hypothetical protein
MCLEYIGCSVDWTDVAQGTEKWQDLVYAKLTFRFHKMREIY